MERLALTVREMADVLGIGVSKAYDLVHVSGFPSIRLRGTYIIPIEALKNWVSTAAGQSFLDSGEE